MSDGNPVLWAILAELCAMRAVLARLDQLDADLIAATTRPQPCA